MNDRAYALANIVLVDDQENAVTIGSAWEHQPALLVFIRHFG